MLRTLADQSESRPYPQHYLLASIPDQVSTCPLCKFEHMCYKRGKQPLCDGAVDARPQPLRTDGTGPSQSAATNETSPMPRDTGTDFGEGKQNCAIHV